MLGVKVGEIVGEIVGLLDGLILGDFRVFDGVLVGRTVGV